MDSDLYIHRGFMLDTGRKFFPVEAIVDLLTVLQQHNFNVFHWHLYDAESFPMHWPKGQGLTNTSIKHSHTSKYYSHEDIQRVISHARSLGILVYPETDMPGHSDIWYTTWHLFFLNMSTNVTIGENGRKIWWLVSQT